jgi:hypothetical protein
MKLPDASKIPPLIQLFQWIADPIGYMEANAQRYGDIFTAQLGKNCRKSVTNSSRNWLSLTFQIQRALSECHISRLSVKKPYGFTQLAC